jgi:pimeloyl-ACP methyl ester carboxylesterase
MVGLLDALDLAEAVIIGHDWGAPAAWNAALLRPDRFRAVAGLSVPYRPRGAISPIAAFKNGGMENLYVMYFQEPGVAEREFERDVKRTLSAVYYTVSGSLPPGQQWSPFVPPGKGFFDTGFEAPMPLPGSAKRISRPMSGTSARAAFAAASTGTATCTATGS